MHGLSVKLTPRTGHNERDDDDNGNMVVPAQSPSCDSRVGRGGDINADSDAAWMVMPMTNLPLVALLLQSPTGTQDFEAGCSSRNCSKLVGCLPPTTQA